MSVAVKNIVKQYGAQKALNDVTFALRKGEICGFLGPNGAGKSTMMKIITGFLREYDGTVEVGGINMRDLPVAAKKMIGYLPEHNPLYTDMYIREYLLYVARMHKIKQSAERVGEVVALTGLESELNKKIGQLSKGYRQRVGLAQALVHDPEVLILDEPMTGLDPNQLEEIRNLILVVGGDKTVMLSTHIMQEVEAICNRVIVINKGSIVADKSKDEFHNLFPDGLQIRVRFATEQEAEWLEEVEGVETVSRMAPGCYCIIPEKNVDPRVALFEAAAAHHSPIIELKMEEQNLEHIFRALTHPKNL